jgi:hypothetical protein
MRGARWALAVLLLAALHGSSAQVCYKTSNTWPVQICDTVICNNATRRSRCRGTLAAGLLSRGRYH